MKKIALLSFDVEEFDMPFEYGGTPDLASQIAASNQGLQKLLPLLDKYSAIVTFYTTGVYATAMPEQIKKMSERHEIASHNHFHSSHKKEDLASSKKILEDITNQTVTGFRMPRMAAVPNQDLIAAGYKYNASVNPCWLPGRYDMRHISRTPFVKDNLLQFPASVSPKYRVPLFWIAFHNFPLWFFFFLIKCVAKKDGFVHLYFHPWEFTDYHQANDGAKYPFYLHRNNGNQMLNRFEKLLQFLVKQGFEFQTSDSFLKDKFVN
jgi:peptidoglycan/xylan/chitin deacetylase (PgdA/CDA1 family)